MLSLVRNSDLSLSLYFLKQIFLMHQTDLVSDWFILYTQYMSTVSYWGYELFNNWKWLTEITSRFKVISWSHPMKSLDHFLVLLFVACVVCTDGFLMYHTTYDSLTWKPCVVCYDGFLMYHTTYDSLVWKPCVVVYSI